MVLEDSFLHLQDPVLKKLADVIGERRSEHMLHTRAVLWNNLYGVTRLLQNRCLVTIGIPGNRWQAMFESGAPPAGPPVAVPVTETTDGEETSPANSYRTLLPRSPGC